MKSDRMISLALTHARLKLARDSLHWALLTQDIVKVEDAQKVMAQLAQWADLAWNKMRALEK